MQIDSASDRGKSPKMSAFPTAIRPFTEPVTATTDLTIGPNKTMSDLIKTYYPSAVPFGFSGRFSFLDRDNKRRDYNPGKEDKFVFNGKSSISMFSKEALMLIEVLNHCWTEIGFPLKKDEDRKIDIPDSEVAWAALDPKHDLHQLLVKHQKDVYFILANVDIMKKACIVRTVNPGWWAVSYKGKKSTNSAFFAKSISAHKRAIRSILASSKGKQIAQEIWAHSSDPIDTNPGYPFFTAQLDAAGNPVTRIKTVDLLKNIKRLAGWDWPKLLKLVDDRAGRFGMAGFPFCVAPLRRQQPGYKWQHQFTITPSGMRTAFDERGVNSQRVAWMVPYVYNVLLTPMQTVMKTVRMVLPGLYHDGPSKTKRTEQLKKQAKSNKLWLAEADYSNYDRFIPTDIIREIMTEFADVLGNKQYWLEAGMYLHEKANLVWPDFSSISDGHGWLFSPGELGLMSGVKATSEAGTLVNSIVNAEVTARTFDWTEDQLYAYLTQYLDAEAGSKYEYYYVQSDDTQLIAQDPSTLQRMGDVFMQAVKAAGLKGAVELADRFLMRHTQDGADRPVPARVWQNTLSNESEPANELIFLAGLVSRTDGLFGVKSVDPFLTGTHQTVSSSEARFTKAMVASLIRFVTTASSKSDYATRFLHALLASGPDITDSDIQNAKSVTGNMAEGLKLKNMRADVSRLLAADQLTSMGALTDEKSILAWIYSLYKDKNIPSSALMLEQLLALNPSLGSSIKMVAAREEAFFRYAANEIGVEAPAL